MTVSQKVLPRIRNLRPGFWVAALVAVLLGGQYLWIRLNRPAHRQEIAAAYGSVGIFYGAPQTDSTGKRITFVETADVGFGVFLCDTATGHKKNVRAQSFSGMGDDFDLKVWPWSPDDRAFAYTDGGKMFICDGDTGKISAEITPPAPIAALTWLTPSSFAAVGNNGDFFHYEMKPDGTWALKRAPEDSEVDFTIRSLIKNITVRASGSSRGGSARNASDGNDATCWVAPNATGSAWLQYEFDGPAWAITRYQLTSAPNETKADPQDWQLLGSNDGSQWTVLDSRTNEFFSARSQTVDYTFSNQNPYQIYRLNIVATSGGGGSGVQLAEFQLLSPDTAGTGSARDEKGPDEGAAKAFDGKTGTKWFNQNGPLPTWLQYSFGGGGGWPLSAYSLTSANDVPERDPRDWQFQVSNDGMNWTTLDRRTNELFASRLQTKSYRFDNATPYRFYRIYVTAASGNGSDGVQLAEFDLGLKELLGRMNDPDGGLALRSSFANVIASASSAQPGASVGNALDVNESTSWASANTNEPAWIQYKFQDATWTITQYKLISSTSHPETDPRNWQLLGSNDGGQWTVLDERRNQTFSARAQARRYQFPNQIPYRFYRLYVTGTAETNRAVRVGKFQLWSDDSPDVMSASSVKLPDESAAKAFDGSFDTKWYNGGSSATGWLQYELGGGEAQVVSSYSLTSGNDVPGRDPQTWEFQASNDGAFWTDLDVRTNQSFDARLQTRNYVFANSKPFRFYRLSMTSKSGDATWGLQLSEFNFGRTPDIAGRHSHGLPVDIDLNNFGTGLNSFSGASCLTTLSSRRIAWLQNNRLWSMSLPSRKSHLLLDVSSTAPADTILRSFSYSKQNGRFLLSCLCHGQNSLWRLDNDDSSSEMAEVPAGGGVIDAVWTSPGSAGWVGRFSNYLRVEQDSGVDPVRIVPRANIDGFSVSSDGRQLFILGAIKNEASSGIWHYDLEAGKLNCVVSYADFPSLYAVRERHTSDSLRLPSGDTLKYDIFPPVDLYHHPHTKYPLIIGDTQFGVALRGAHGRLWIPAISACGAYVVIVNRGGWFAGLDQWGDNVTAVYQQLAQTLSVDKNQVYLFGASAETTYMGQIMAKSPGLWKGVILLNPTGLPDFSKSPIWQPRPKILISAGGEEQDEDRLKRYQAEALNYGAIVEYYTEPGEGHHFVGNVAQRKRTAEIMHFIFEE